MMMVMMIAAARWFEADLALDVPGPPYSARLATRIRQDLRLMLVPSVSQSVPVQPGDVCCG